MKTLTYPVLRKWSLKSVRWSLEQLEKAEKTEYEDKTIRGLKITADDLRREISRRTGNKK